MEGWGSCFQGQSTGGDWLAEEAKHHINWLELRAALQCKRFVTDHRDSHIWLMIDNTTAIAYINKMGSTKPALLQLTQELTSGHLEDVQLSAAHIPGRLNVVADAESHTHNVDTE